jgi:hypothetical protein
MRPTNSLSNFFIFKISWSFCTVSFLGRHGVNVECRALRDGGLGRKNVHVPPPPVGHTQSRKTVEVQPPVSSHAATAAMIP